MLAYGLSAPFAGQLIDRLGARITYAFGLTTLGIGYLLAGSATELWQYLLTVGLLGGLGSASLGMIVASGLLSRWFTTRIGAVMALPYAAVGAGMLILPPLTQLLLSTYDWRVDASPARRRRAAGAAARHAAAARPHDGRLGRLARHSPAGRHRQARLLERLDRHTSPAPSGACSRPICSPRLPPTACCRTRSPISSSRASIR